MIRKFVLAGAAIAILSMPAMAAATYYVAQDATSKKCSVVEKKPDGKTLMMIGKKGFKTEGDASAAMKKDKGCM